MKCKRCNWTRDKLDRSFMIIEHELFCELCLKAIIKEWLIKKQEIDFLGQGRNNCKINGIVHDNIAGCTYEINHEGDHSWEV